MQKVRTKSIHSNGNEREVINFNIFMKISILFQYHDDYFRHGSDLSANMFPSGNIARPSILNS